MISLLWVTKVVFSIWAASLSNFSFSFDLYGSFVTEAWTSWMIWKLNCRLPSHLLSSSLLGGSLSSAQVSQFGQMNFRPRVKGKSTACLCLVGVQHSGAITNSTPSLYLSPPLPFCSWELHHLPWTSALSSAEPLTWAVCELERFLLPSSSKMQTLLQAFR